LICSFKLDEVDRSAGISPINTADTNEARAMKANTLKSIDVSRVAP
jgi:hypothetical protein